MSELTMSQIVKRKAIFEQELLLLVVAFEEETGTCVEQVELIRSYQADKKNPVLAYVETTVRL